VTGPIGAERTDTPDRDVSQNSVGELIGEVARDLSTLMRQELRLARAELRDEAAKTGKAAGMVGAAGFAGYMVLLFVSTALWWGLSNVMDQSWAALIVAALWAVAGSVLYSAGRKRLSGLNPTPERTAETLKDLPDTIRGR
jgi:hypothetical protein